MCLFYGTQLLIFWQLGAAGPGGANSPVLPEKSVVNRSKGWFWTPREGPEDFGLPLCEALHISLIKLPEFFGAF
jgi:hypothetical protein